MSDRMDVTVLGATGVVGQRFVRRLRNHPWFRLKHLAASAQSEGKAYRDACDWRLGGDPAGDEAYGGFGDHRLVAATPEDAFAPIVFSALDSGPAKDIEPRFAAAGSVVFSNASAFRMAADVPLLVPEANADHLGLLSHQRAIHGTSGGIVTNPNCTSTVAVVALAALHRRFGVQQVHLTSMQAVSGAGYPGVASLDILGNVIPFIRSEEEKVQEELPKMLGRFAGESIDPAQIVVSAACHRVPVLEGHSEAISVRLGGDPDPVEVAEVLRAFRSDPQLLELPSAPRVPIVVYDDPTRPQVRLDVERDEGMSIHVGRVRRCPLFGVKFFLLGHNTERGAAGASVLNAELALARSYLTESST